MNARLTLAVSGKLGRPWQTLGAECGIVSGDGIRRLPWKGERDDAHELLRTYARTSSESDPSQLAASRATRSRRGRTGGTISRTPTTGNQVCRPRGRATLWRSRHALELPGGGSLWRLTIWPCGSATAAFGVSVLAVTFGASQVLGDTEQVERPGWSLWPSVVGMELKVIRLRAATSARSKTDLQNRKGWLPLRGSHP